MDETSKIVAKKEEVNLIEASNIHRRLIEAVRSGIFLAGIRNKLTYVNHAFVEILGYNIKDDVLGLNFMDALFKDKEEKSSFWARIEETGFVRDFEFPYLRKDGFTAFFSLTCHYIYDDKGAVIGAEGTLHDVTERRRLEEDIVTEKKKMEQILTFDEQISTIREFDALVDFIVEKTADILEVQKCSLMLVDNHTGELFIQKAKGLDERVIQNSRIKLGEPVAGNVAQSKMPLLVKNVEYDQRFHRANRMYYFSRSFMIVPICLEGKIIGVLNVTDKKTAGKEKMFDEVDLRILGAIAREVAIAFVNVNLYKELSHLTITDPLTLIYNYRQFSKSLHYEIKRHKRHEGNLALIMMDVDDFKEYNDTFGHLEGDALLKGIGQILTGQLRETDIICRYGGDEFAIILPDVEIEGAKKAAEKVRQAVEQSAFKTKITISIGIAGYDGNADSYEFIKKADQALYAAKNKGKNTICAQT